MSKLFVGKWWFLDNIFLLSGMWGGFSWFSIGSPLQIDKLCEISFAKRIKLFYFDIPLTTWHKWSGLKLETGLKLKCFYLICNRTKKGHYFNFVWRVETMQNSWNNSCVSCFAFFRQAKNVESLKNSAK